MKFWFLLGILSINVYTEGSKVKKDIASYSFFKSIFFYSKECCPPAHYVFSQFLCTHFYLKIIRFFTSAIIMDDDAQIAALEQIAALLQRPDQLEKLPELRKKAERKRKHLFSSIDFFRVMVSTFHIFIEGTVLKGIGQDNLVSYFLLDFNYCVEDLQLARASVPCFPLTIKSMIDSFICIITVFVKEYSKIDYLLRFVEMTRNDMKNWLEKTLSAEKDFRIGINTCDQRKEILDISILVYLIFFLVCCAIQYLLANAFTSYRNKYFENRAHYREFTSTMVSCFDSL
uniref:Gustatory receptor n=1 Tax=Heterorhabditis bacteriophora TaxID=37862 RepID=A0A1I7X194_HETBA